MVVQLMNKTPNVAFVRTEVRNAKDVWDLIRDCIAGERQVKFRRQKYLPIPNSDDTSKENSERYRAYLTRAIFYNVTRRTLEGLVGQIFLRDPVVELPTIMDVIKTDASGSGITLDQQASLLSKNVLAFGRTGVLVDYPNTDTPATAAQVQAGKVRPAILTFPAWDIINWRTVVIDGREVLSLVVIHEDITSQDDGFEQKTKEQWRVLYLDDTLQYVEAFWEASPNGGFVATQMYMPKDSSGNRFKEIPFTFVGSENNDPDPDNAPLYDIASLNIAHYRNSADYEEAVFIIGQPTLLLIGLTQEWVDKVLKGKVNLGSRSAVMLPTGAGGELLQAQPNTMAKEAMDQKERQMVALGAKLVEDRSVQRTLGEAELEHTSETSILANVAKNVEAALTYALNICAQFMGADASAIKYELNTEFDLTQMDPAERAQVIKEWQAGATTFSEMRQNLRRGGVATLDDEAAKKELATDRAAGIGPPPVVAPVDPNNPAGTPPKTPPKTPVENTPPAA